MYVCMEVRRSDIMASQRCVACGEVGSRLKFAAPNTKRVELVVNCMKTVLCTHTNTLAVLYK